MAEHTPLWKQLLGAATGALVALGCYYGYEAAAPQLTAYLFPPGVQDADELSGGARFADNNVKPGDPVYDRMASRNREAAERVGGGHAAPATETKTTVIEMPEETVAQAQLAATVAENALHGGAEKRIGKIEKETSSVSSKPRASTRRTETKTESEKLPVEKLPDSGVGFLGSVALAGMLTVAIRRREEIRKALRLA